MEKLKIAVINKWLLTKEDTATLEKMASEGKLISQDLTTAKLDEHHPVDHPANDDQHHLVKLLLEYGTEKTQEIPSDIPTQKPMEFLSHVGNRFCTNTFKLHNNYLEFRCYAGEGLPVESVRHIIHGINEYFGPNIKDVLQGLEIDNYHVTFIVTQIFRY
ncbi:hypothetical protein HPY28_19330 [Brevibacillus sp. HB1.2]|uniref:hypothetical protein n=1 Tax=Brevibacillus sp. HB1.2 TaxID=2738807 RepID=UPI0015754466|nr:hypothetical protein [Brevibacillus sp. HB1.2]NTU22478.1 hypothetical protein [Brevibacillus sp. HB1.2]